MLVRAVVVIPLLAVPVQVPRVALVARVMTLQHLQVTLRHLKRLAVAAVEIQPAVLVVHLLAVLVGLMQTVQRRQQIQVRAVAAKVAQAQTVAQVVAVT
jgi:hypothetical protein